MGGLEPYALIWSPMSDIALEPAQFETDQTVLILAHDGPLAVSVASDGVNYLCSGCSRLVLQDVHPRQFLSIVIRCVRCGGISATPKRDAGEPIPSYSVVAPAGQYLLGASEAIRRDVPVRYVAGDASPDISDGKKCSRRSFRSLRCNVRTEQTAFNAGSGSPPAGRSHQIWR